MQNAQTGMTQEAALQVFFSAKIQPPRMGDRIYPCQRLFNQMETLLKQGHLWISGAPGAGKTILATQFLSRGTTPAAWYKLDSLDTDPVSFFSLFPQAFSFARSIPSTTFSLPKLSPEDMLGLPNFARSFFRQLFSQLPKHWLLVFDNFHEIPSGSPILDLLAICLEELPVHCRVILLSRTSPPASFARMRVNNQLQVLDPAALHFTRQEIAAILSLHGIDAQEKENLDYFNRMTSGWAAGLTLLLREYAQIKVTKNWPNFSNHSELFDYFTEEFFSRFKKNDQELLLLASFLPEIRAAILDFFYKSSSEQFFTALSRSDFFTYALDPQEQSFQFHPLLKDFLLKKAKAVLPETTLTAFLEQTAELLITEGREEEAINLFNRADLPEKSIKLIKKSGLRLLEQGRFKTLLHWKQILPADLVTHDPWLLFFFGTAITAFDPPQGVELLQQCFTIFQRRGEQQAAFMACASLTSAIINHFSDLSVLDPWLDYLEEHLEPTMLSASTSFENVFITTSIFRAIILRRPTHPDLNAWLELVIQQEGMRPSLITHYLWTGRFIEARAALDNIYAHKDRVASKLQMSVIHAMEAQYYLIMADADNCVRIIDKSLQMMEESGVRVWELHLLVLGAGCCLNCGEHEKATRYLQMVEENIERARLLERSYYYVVKTLEALLDNNLTDADHYQKTALQMAITIGMPSYTLWCLQGSALVAVHQGKTEQAIALFDQVITLATTPGNPWFVCQAHLGLAWLYFNLGDKNSARENLREGLALAAHNNYLTFFFFIPRMMEILTVAALEEGIENDFVCRFITRWELEPKHPPVHLDAWPWPLKIYTLGRFSVIRHGKKMEASSLAGGKPAMLLRALIALGGRQVRKSQLADIFWPDSNGDEQLAALKITLHRLRKLLGIKGALIQTTHHLSLNPSRCWVDCWQFERLANRAQLCGHENDMRSETVTRKALNVYRGVFLGTFQEEPWSFAYRQRLENLFQRVAAVRDQQETN